MHGRWRLGCLVGCELWLDSPGEGRGNPSPSGPPSWKTSWVFSKAFMEVRGLGAARL